VIWLDDGDQRLLLGDALEQLSTLPAGSVDCVITSPPYYGLRDYNVDQQIGLEPTLDAYIDAIVGVFREARRVLADHGTCWINLGDSFAANRTYQVPDSKHRDVGNYMPAPATGLPVKNLLGVPWRVALALQDDGWILRRDIIWSKPNPMPESVTDRPTTAHEYVFLLTKKPRYFYDANAVREPNQPDGRKVTGVTGRDGSVQHRDGERWPNPAGRNLRSVWEIPTQPTPDAHFATYPEELVRRCLLAGCPAEVCGECGKPRERLVEREAMVLARSERTHPMGRTRTSGTMISPPTSTTLGWSDCGHAAYRPGVCLDPFCGSGTTLKVARDHARRGIGIDLSPAYLAIATRRLQQLSLLADAEAVP
jgi:site-specific DNA-methyltransferase (cytosine-N4-specific)